MPANPSSEAPMVTSARIQFARNIFQMTPTNSASELMRFAVLEESVWLIVSTSFVTRERMSPLVAVSKYRSGRRLIFSSISRRRRFAVYCVTVAVMNCCP